MNEDRIDGIELLRIAATFRDYKAIKEKKEKIFYIEINPDSANGKKERY